MARRGAALAARIRAPEALLGGLFALWSLLPFALLFLGRDPGVFNGSNGLQVADHMQYLAFIRDAGENVLFSNRMDVASDPHLFLHPVSAISGLLWRLGASIQLAFLAWLPLTVALLVLGYAAYVRRLVAGRGQAAAALALALFYFSIAAPLTDWLGADPELEFGTLIVGLEMFTGAYPWGGFPGAISVACMPLFLLGVERVLEPARRAAGRSARWYAVWTGVAGMLASWLHPWQGITLLVIVGCLVAWGRFERRYLALAGPVVLTAAPLAYLWILTQTDSSWAAVSRPNDFAHAAGWFFLGMLPVLLALPGFAGRDLDLQERMLRIWPFAALFVYFTLQSSWFYHALIALSLPLSILAVRGWSRLRLPRVAGVAAIAALTLPGMVFIAAELRDTREKHFFEPDERRALEYLDRSARRGPVLAAREPLGEAAPGFSGRQTFVGHYTWTPDYYAREDRAEALFDGRLGRRQALALVRESRAAFLASDCRDRADLRSRLRPVLVRVRRLGCATVYEVRPSP
jgi:hypothetical protein